jgi:tetratricopeptide (TPR) repeat protein
MKKTTPSSTSLTTLRLFGLCALLATSAQWAVAADTAPPPPAGAKAASADKLGAARALIASKQWTAALEELRRVNDTGSADWNNLMGYSLRKGKTPDLAAAQRHYDEALRIDPHHRNALEYSGELYLMKNELGKAEARLASLAAECGAASCEQHADLKGAIERYKSAGNKFVPTW